VTFLCRSLFLFLSLTLQGVAFAQLHEVGDGSIGPVKAAHSGRVQVLPELLSRSEILAALSQPGS
jgi:hypothetical protein